MSDTIYCGSGKAIKGETKDGGKYQFLKLGFGPKDLKILQENTNSKGWVNVIVGKRKQESEHGQTHYLKIDTFEPKQKAVEDAHVVDSSDDLPF